MDMIEEEYTSDEYEQEQGDILKEAWPLPVADTVREFEEYLLDIGVRI